MISRFSVKNYKSYKDKFVLDFQAANISEHKEHLLTSSIDEKLLPICALYGPNGGGKSNIVKALNALIIKVVAPIMAAENKTLNFDSFDDNFIRPFAFDETAYNEPTWFELYAPIGSGEFKYVLETKNDQVIYEELYYLKVDNEKHECLFIRENFKVETYGVLDGLLSEIKIADDLPFLSYLGITYQGVDIIKEIINWFTSSITFINYANPSSLFTMFLPENTIKNRIREMIEEVDLGIVDYETEKTDENKINIFTLHRRKDIDYRLLIEQESCGTRKILPLLAHIAVSLIYGITLVIDELDSELHPLLLKYIIGLYTSKQSNVNNSQLIFTSHDIVTMTNTIFRRDEIWFAAKNIDQESQLYSLVDFIDNNGKRVRNDASYGKQYLEGKYGADPYFNRIINWGKYHGKA